MTEQAHRYTLRNRYVFTGKLVMQTAFHIGGGKATLSNSDSPIVLTPEELPFIPGSSFKGALRSTVEKLVPGLATAEQLRTCALIELSEKELKEAREKAEDEAEYKRQVCPTIRQKEITQERRDHPGAVQAILAQTLNDLCHTCQLFGSPFAASHINISDLYMPTETWNGIVQRRDGVAIDRDSEKAKDRLKYDFEVVPASAEFELYITLENATDEDLQLISVGLSEFVHGFGVIGGKRSRGLGVCRLDNLKVSELVLEGVAETVRNARLRDYLLKRKFSDELDGNTFLNKYIEQIFAKA